MSENNANCIGLKERERELDRLIGWVKDNPRDWTRICNPNCYEPSVEYICELVEKLYEEKLLTIIYLVIHANWAVKEVGWVIDRTKNECLMDISKSALIERFRHNLQFMARDKE